MWKLLALTLLCPCALAAPAPVTNSPAGTNPDTATSTTDSCSPAWFADQLKSQLPAAPAPAHYDFVPTRDLPDAELADRVRSGQFSVVFDLIATAMEDGAASPENIGLRASATVLNPLLQELTTRLKDKHLDKLSVFIAGPESQQAPYQALMSSVGAKLVFVPVKMEACDPAIKPEKHSKPKAMAKTKVAAKTAATKPAAKSSAKPSTTKPSAKPAAKTTTKATANTATKAKPATKPAAKSAAKKPAKAGVKPAAASAAAAPTSH